MTKNVLSKHPHHITRSKLKLKAIEWNIIYAIVGKLQGYLQNDVHYNFKEQEVRIAFRDISSLNNYTRLRKAFSSIVSREVEFELNVPGTDKIKKKVTTLISGLDYVVNSGYVTFYVPKSACVFFCYIGGGYTRLQICIVINLNSIYSKLMYEFCCRWADKGGFSCTIEQLREVLAIEGKYNQIAHLRQKVLDVASDELKTKADYYFSYSLSKNGHRKYSFIHIKIHKNTINVEDTYLGVNEQHYSYVYNFLLMFYPNYQNNKALEIVERIAQKGNINKAYYRFERLDREFANGKTKQDIANLLKYVILPEFGLPKPKKNRSSHQNNKECELVKDLVKRCDLFSKIV
ncbi:replication initiation protein [Zobellia russellii]|uniref:replication initiation protein n=1 Tax=Zobellia russellii TaxID=248907 RepID=UPI001BFF43CB|nr:replication initiation protein [Zobellia russellii]MBT9187768.1 replication initiation protein [Zobellia russellii]